MISFGRHLGIGLMFLLLGGLTLTPATVAGQGADGGDFAPTARSLLADQGTVTALAPSPSWPADGLLLAALGDRIDRTLLVVATDGNGEFAVYSSSNGVHWALGSVPVPAGGLSAEDGTQYEVTDLVASNSFPQDGILFAAVRGVDILSGGIYGFCR